MVPQDPSRFGREFAARLGSRLIADGWEESRAGGARKGQFRTTVRPEGPVHRVRVAGHRYPESLRVLLHTESAEARDAIAQLLGATTTPLRGLTVRNARSRDRDPRCAFALEVALSRSAIDAAPWFGDPATVADHFHELIQVAIGVTRADTPEEDRAAKGGPSEEDVQWAKKMFPGAAIVLDLTLEEEQWLRRNRE